MSAEVSRTVRRGRGFAGQAVLESAVALPILIALVCGCFDLGRFAYVRGTLDANARRAARQLTLPSGQTSDCAGLRAAVVSGNGIAVDVDPQSYAGGGSPTVPPPGSGYVYISPAVATAPNLSNCDGGSRGSSVVIHVTVTYQFVPWTPLLGSLVGNHTVTVDSSAPSEY